MINRNRCNRKTGVTRAFLLIASLTIAITGTGCNQKTQSGETTHDFNVRIREVEPLESNRINTISWLDPAEKPLFQSYDTIVQGTVHNIREIEVTYASDRDGSDRIYYATLYDMRLTEVIVQEDDLTVGDVITMYCALSSYTYDADTTPLTENNEYIVFAENFRNVNTERDLLGMRNIADYAALNRVMFVILLNEDTVRDKKMKTIIDLLNEPVNGGGTHKIEENTWNQENNKIDRFKDIIRLKKAEFDERK